MKKVLLTNFEIVQFSGSEINCITLAERFHSKGYEVYIGALNFGDPLYSEIKDLGYTLINLLEGGFDFSAIEFDIIWAQHSFLLDWLIFEKNVRAKKIVASSLSGKEPFECMPLYAGELSMILANSYETKEKLETVENVKDVSLFENYSFMRYFERGTNVTELRRIAIVSNHIPDEENSAAAILRDKGYPVDVYGLSGIKKLVTDEVLSDYDAVVTIGKTVQFAMSLAIPVYVYDIHGGPGYLSLENLDKCRLKNFSGRGFSKKSGDAIADEIVNDFPSALKDKEALRAFAKENFCFETIFDSTLEKLEHAKNTDVAGIKEKYASLSRNISLSKKIAEYVSGRNNAIIRDANISIIELKEDNKRLYGILAERDSAIGELREENSRLYQRIDSFLSVRIKRSVRRILNKFKRTPGKKN
ncbi:MAG: hypothetical protein IJS45_05425 [Clostridia bacterium]|nr:hypothetical protein [Clostridia bacterium]